MEILVRYYIKIGMGLGVFLLLLIPLFILFSYNPLAYALCVMRGDAYEQYPGAPGVRAYYYCVHTYTDGGKQCKSSSECQGRCLLTDETQVVSTGGLSSKVIGGWGACERNNRNTDCFPGTIEDPISWCI